MLLGLSDSALESIQNSCLSLEDRQLKMVEQWKDTGHAYWSILLDHLKGPVLGEVGLARTLAEEHLGKKLNGEGG